MLKEIYNKKIIYSCNLNKNYKFSLIFNLSNNKLIGMNQNIYNNYNTGIFFKYVINELFLDNYYEEYNDNKVIIHTNCHENLIDSNLPYFKEIHKKKFVEKNNIIDILINIDQKDINKEIYFLDDKYFNFKNNKFIYCRNNLKELNQTNTELYINNIKYEYKKYFIPEKVGKYNIKLKFKINLTDCSYMFNKCHEIREINFISFNTKYVKSMEKMFYECRHIKNINLSSFDTKNVTDMSSMFYYCEKLIDLNYLLLILKMLLICMKCLNIALI